MTPSWRVAIRGGFLFAMLGLVPSAAAQPAAFIEDPVRDSGTRIVIAGPDYRAGSLHQLLFGRHYRDLWTTPIAVDVLDLDAFAGGLTPLRRGGGMQTKSLRLAGTDGRTYVIRSVNKDPSPNLPGALRQTVAARLLQDQISSGHPAAALVTAPLLSAAGVLHPTPHLIIVPDHPRLGAFRAEFAGMLATIEERPDDGPADAPGFGGAWDVVLSATLLDRLESNPTERVDARAYLAARLMDLYVGDWDRHQDQWLWARRQGESGSPWTPIPRDRDQAFARLDGVALWIARQTVPRLVSFGPEYPSIMGLTWTGQELDRRLLAELDRPTWESVARVLAERLTDSVIVDAVAQLPPAYAPLDAERLGFALRRRRDGLPEAAGRFYAQLAQWVDIHLSDRRERVSLRRTDDRTVEIVVRRADEADGRPLFHRVLDARETHEVRLYLHGGDDQVVVEGSGASPITLRVIGGGGDDEVVDSSGAGRVNFYDAKGRNRVVGRRARIDTRPYREPPRSGVPPEPFRDWGTRWMPKLSLTMSPDLGLIVSGGVERTRFGFRKVPYSSRLSVGAAYATGADRFRLELAGEFPRENSRVTLGAAVRLSGIEVSHFYGLGNETPGGPRDRFRVRQQQLTVFPSLTTVPTSHLRVTLGPVLKYAETDPASGEFITLARPYGTPRFGQVGFRWELAADGRDHPVAARRGGIVSVGGTAYPAAWDVQEPFAEVHGEAAVFFTAPIGPEPTLALRAGGKKVWGRFPFHEAAFLGGAATLRGWSEQRFAGSASAWGNAELRVPVGEFFLVVPGRWGVFGLADAGRVWAAGEDSNRWHTGVGGGVWLAFLGRGGTVSAAVVRGAERSGLYLTAGFAY